MNGCSRGASGAPTPISRAIRSSPEQSTLGHEPLRGLQTSPRYKIIVFYRLSMSHPPSKSEFFLNAWRESCIISPSDSFHGLESRGSLSLLFSGPGVFSAHRGLGVRIGVGIRVRIGISLWVGFFVAFCPGFSDSVLLILWQVIRKRGSPFSWYL